MKTAHHDAQTLQLTPGRSATAVRTEGETGQRQKRNGSLTRNPVRDAQDEVMLRILATTDVHANVMSYDYASNRPINGMGLVRMASLIAAARAEVPSAVLLDNGDFLQGSIMADLAAQARRRRAHPIIAAMNALDYDAAALGNHEFNYGLDVLSRALSEARFPIVSANILRQRGQGGPLSDEPFAPPYAILDRVLHDRRGRAHSLRIGILGLTPPEVLRWDHSHLAGQIDARPMVETARAWVPVLRRAGADIVVCLAHTGIAESIPTQETEGLGADLAELPGIDALVLGHSHLVFPHRAVHPDNRVDGFRGLVAGKPVVQPGHSGSHLGIMDLRLRCCAGEGWSVVGSDVRAESVSEFAAGVAPAVLRRHAGRLMRAVGSDHRAALAWTRRPLGETELPLPTSFAQVADTAVLRLTGKAKVDYGRRILAGTPHECLPVLAAVTPYRAGGRGGPLNYTSIPAGPLSLRHVFDLHPFPDTVVGLIVSGRAIVEQLERSAALYAQILPGTQDQPLIDPAFPAYAFTVISGVSYEIDLSSPARYDPRGRLIRPETRRIVNLRRGGIPVRDDDRFVLVTNNFRAGGPLASDPPLPDGIAFDHHELCTDMLGNFITHIRKVSAAALRNEETWSLQLMPETTVQYAAGPAAEMDTIEASRFRPTPIGLSEDGFHLLRLHL